MDEIKGLDSNEKRKKGFHFQYIGRIYIYLYRTIHYSEFQLRLGVNE